MSAFCHDTDVDHGGGSGEDVTDDQDGSPDRLIDVTSQPLATADLQILEPVCLQWGVNVRIWPLSLSLSLGILTKKAIAATYDDLLLCHHTVDLRG